MANKAASESLSESLIRISAVVDEVRSQRDIASGSNSATQAYVDTLLSVLPTSCVRVALEVARFCEEAHDDLHENMGSKGSAEHHGGQSALRRIAAMCEPRLRDERDSEQRSAIDRLWRARRFGEKGDGPDG